ncbi:MAG: T9SS type A sorting domain-containing protein, partial [Chitinivibrionales bacterium]|nr:T9SS type A sorting domain-containing protein [Chitinivibrionales bacterium]
RHGLVHLENAENITVQKCRIFNAGIMGVLFNNHAQNNTLTNCWIEGVNYCAVYLTSYCIGTGPWDYINHHNNVVNNFIHDFGKLWSNGSGVQIYQSGDNEIANNLIRRGPRYACSMKGKGSTDSQYILSNNNNIHHNEICHTLNSTWDTGTLESWNAGTGNKWNTNLFHDIFHITIPTRTYDANGDPFPVGLGISQRHCMYPDAGPSIEITDNVAYNIIDYIDWHHNAPGDHKTFPNNFYPHPYTRSKAKEMAEGIGIAFDDIGLSDDFPFPTPEVREYTYPVEAVINPIFEEDIYSQMGDGTGLTGVYYSGTDFNQEVIAKVDPLPGMLWFTSPAGSSNWSARWTGTVVPLFTEEHRFCATTNGGCRMWVNGTQVFEDWQTFSPSDPWEAKDCRLILSREFIPLEAGQEYEVTIEFFSQSTDANLAIDWYSHSMPTHVIPTSQLKPDPSVEVGIQGPYAAGNMPEKIRIIQAQGIATVNVPFDRVASATLIAPNGAAVATVSGTNTGSIAFNTRPLAAGMYLVSVVSNKGTSVRKLVLNK